MESYMKKNIKSNLILLSSMTLVLLLSSCGTTTIKGNDPVMTTNRPEIIDYPGFALGKEIPSWVIAVDEGSNKKVGKALDLDSDKQLFVITNKGVDLDFLKTWTDQVDVRSEVANSLSTAVANAVEATMSGTEKTAIEKEKIYKQYSISLTNLELNGLKKEAQYWVKYRVLTEEGKKAKDATNKYISEYTYYVVFSINKDIYSQQLDAAINGVEDNASETEMLKKTLTEKLNQTILPSESVGFSK